MNQNNMPVNKTGQKKKFPTWAWWLIGILGGLILIGLGYLVASNQYKAKNQELQNQIDELQGQELTTSTTSSTSTSSKTDTSTDPTADWKTYTNKEAGYTIKHPSDWAENLIYNNDGCVAEYYQPSSRTTLFSPEAQKDAKTLCEEQREGCTGSITIDYFDDKAGIYSLYQSLANQNDMELQEWVNNVTDLGGNKIYSQVKEISINGYPAIEAEGNVIVTATHCNPVYTVFIERDGSYYLIERPKGETSNASTKTDELVINSFEFTN